MASRLDIITDNSDSRDRIECVVYLQGYNLTKPDLLQILNLRPQYPVELALIGGQCNVSLWPQSVY